MPEFHAPFTREELERRGWRIESCWIEKTVDNVWLTVNALGRFHQLDRNTGNMNTEYLGSFEKALSKCDAAEALLKGEG